MTEENATAGAVRVLLVEDDPGDALLAREYLSASTPQIAWVQTVTAACHSLADADVDCVLLDLDLPDTMGLEGLAAIQAAAPDLPIVVLTGDSSETRGIDAVAAGAQDYLIKGQVDAALLGRSVRYATERKRADVSMRHLAAAQIRADENSRLQRGLLPVPLLPDDAMVEVVGRYRPGRAQAHLGGDFFDVVQTPDGRIWALIGDVAGHGADEAALGVCLRVGWRTLVLAGHEPDDVLPALQQLLVHERHHDEIFATVAMLVIDEKATAALVLLAGHPAPLLSAAGSTTELQVCPGLPLGVNERAVWEPQRVTFGEDWSLLVFTDGLVEGFIGPERGARLDVEGLVALLASRSEAHSGDVEAGVDALVADVVARNGGPLVDDMALLHLRRRS